MNLFKDKLINRIAIWKSIGFLFWLIWFFLIPIFFTDTSLMFQFAILLWYTTVWAFIWVFWVFTKYPIFNLTISYWFRWIWIWAWMTFILILFIYNDLSTMMAGSFLESYSPFWMIIDWAFFWLLVDFICTKYIWEGKKLLD